MIDRGKIRNEYISTKTSYRKLAEKYGVSVDAIKRVAASERWTAERTKTAPKIHQKTVEKIIEKTADVEADRIVRLSAVGDTLIAQIERAAQELDKTTTRKTTRRRQTVAEHKDGKTVTQEVINTEEELAIVQSLVDRSALRTLAGALKDVMELMGAGKKPDTGLMESLLEVMEHEQN